MPDTKTRENLVEVAARLLREQGAAAVTTRAVALAAGVQAPAIYRLFGDKDGLLDAVLGPAGGLGRPDSLRPGQRGVVRAPHQSGPRRALAGRSGRRGGAAGPGP